MRVQESIDIARPREEVWAFVADPVNDLRWCKKVKSVEPAGERCWRVTHRPVPLRPAVDLTVEHLAVDPPSRLTMREEDDTSTFEVEYRLEATAAGTRITQISDFEWKKYGRLIQSQMARGVRNDVRNQLKALKRLMETSR